MAGQAEKEGENMHGENGLPPYTNRGAQNTYGNGLRACVDWVQATLKFVSVEQLISSVLSLDMLDFHESENGKYGYQNSKRFGHIAIYYNGREDMGIHLEISGQGCREYELLQKQSWQELFQKLFICEANFTRLDIAIDDFEEHFKIPGIVRRIKNRQLISKFKNAVRIENIDIETGGTQGNTVYFGASTSRIQIRMYEKNHERMARGHELMEGVESWNRTEIQARKERAQRIAKIIADGDTESDTIGQTVTGILKYYMRFLVKGTDKNRARWKTAPFWEKFLGNVEELRLTDVAPDKTIEKSELWVDKQVAPTLAKLHYAYDGDMDLIKRIITDGAKRLKEKDYAMIERFKDEHADRENILQGKKITYESEYKQTVGAVLDNQLA